MRARSCDVAIIGAGSAGLAARTAAVAAGAKTILIESGKGGTTCARFGCMPSKLLLHAAAAARQIDEAPGLGVLAGRADVRGRAVLKRVRRERDYFVNAVLADVAAIPSSQKIAGHARFVGPNTIAIDDRLRLTAKAIVVAAGAKPSIPDELAAVKARVLTHETVFELPNLPKSIAVIGAGPLGIELALAMARLGVRTDCFDTAHAIAGARDADVLKAGTARLSRELNLHLGVTYKAGRLGAGVKLSWRKGKGREHSGTFDYVLAASGRAPNLAHLDLQMSGLRLDEDGIPEFDTRTMRCGDSSIFLAGDVNDDRPVLHEASRQGELAGRNAALYPNVVSSPPGPPFSVVFTDPDFAQVGATMEELKDDIVDGCSDDSGRAHVEFENKGLLKVYARRSDGLVAGGEMFGLDVEHLAHLLAWAVQLELTVEEMLALPYYHPTVEEGLRTALRDLKRKLA